MMGHESTSVNNPYIAAYGCGACSGRSGAVNARAFAQMANDAQVRVRVMQRFGIEIPTQTRFVPAAHDTCQDIVTFYLGRKMRAELTLGSSDDLKSICHFALYKNAQERVRSFKLVGYGTHGKDAQKEVLRRSRSLFETPTRAWSHQRGVCYCCSPSHYAKFESWAALISPVIRSHNRSLRRDPHPDPFSCDSRVLGN